MESSRIAGSRAREALRSGGALRLAALALGAIGAALLVMAELSTIVTIDVLTTGTCEEIAAPDVRDACEVDGLEQHGGALIVLGVLALLMAVGAVRGASAPAALALIVIGAVVVALAVRDFTASDETGLVGITFEQAEAGVDTGFYLELAGAGLCIAAGALGLLRWGD
ncbi:hypothetical protein BH20ACT19_BH20ACT19_03540 [soil metagenome]